MQEHETCRLQGEFQAVTFVYFWSREVQFLGECFIRMSLDAQRLVYSQDFKQKGEIIPEAINNFIPKQAGIHNEEISEIFARK